MTVENFQEELCQVSSLMYIISTAATNESLVESEFFRSLPAALTMVYKRLDVLRNEFDNLESEGMKNGEE